MYVVATPLGNLADITLRALDVLRAADFVAAEDTRHTRRLLDHHGIAARLLAAHQHNEREAAAAIVAAIGEGKRVALVSDAGTPAVSDPGARIVRAVSEAGLRVIPVPGPSALTAALSASGLGDERVLFCGFLPARAGTRGEAIEALKALDAALVFYEAPHRVAETVADLAARLDPRREMVIARELTKLFESIARMPLADAPAWLAADPNRERGEFVLLVSAPAPRQGLPAEADRVLAALLAELPLKQAVKLAAQITGEPRNALYERALSVKGE
ncbi:MAG: 16S rRNA (cytidine(1402)-2'-O)-methyltransferase [Sterolibacteriaceae bacterium]|nr:16S rRNA (cytidine(1402)-2'-O)-methyltransferase [Candidatus Methylophosphatis haderslevensis]